MTMDFGLSEVNCSSLYQALKIIEKEIMIIPHLIHRSSNFQRFLESPSVRPRTFWCTSVVHHASCPFATPYLLDAMRSVDVVTSPSDVRI